MTQSNHQGKNTPQHCRLTVDRIVELYQFGYLTAKGALGLWVEAKLAEGWETVISPKSIQELFSKNNKPMARSTFWGAMHSLQEDGLIDFDQPERIHIKRLPKPPENGEDSAPKTVPSEILNDVRNSEPPSEILNPRPKNRTTVRNSEPPSEILNEQQPQPRPEKASSIPPNSDHINYQSFIKSLSEVEGENFQKWIELEISKLPWPIQNIHDWLASRDAHGNYRFADYWENYQLWLSVETESNAETDIPLRVEEYVNGKTVNSKEFLNWLTKSWGAEKFKDLILKVYQGWVYFRLNDSPWKLDQLIKYDICEIESIALG